MAAVAEEDYSIDDQTLGQVVKIFSLPQGCVPRIIGNNGTTIAELRARHGCGVAINQDTKEKGYSVCTVRGNVEDAVIACKGEIDRIMEESKLNASKEVQIPQKYVGMIIGASGVTLAKIRKHTGAQIEVIQDTANDGFSVAHVAGTLEQVDKTVDVISKMVVSGRQASEGYQEYLKNVQAGLVPAAPFKPDKMPGLEFLEEECEKPGGAQKSARNSATNSGSAWGYTPRSKGGPPAAVGAGGPPGTEVPRGGFVGGGIGIKGGSGKGIAFVDASKHTLSDTFEVPQKYVGLLVGKQGEAIRRFRQYAAERDMAIRVNQDDPQSAASVVITGNEMDDIVALKADMTQNLFQAIAKLDANGPKGPMKGSPPSKGMDQMWGGGGGKGMSGGGKSSSSYHGGGYGGHKAFEKGGYGHYDKGAVPTPEVYYGPAKSGGKKDAGPYGKPQDDGDWWTSVFNQLGSEIEDKIQGGSGGSQDWGNWGSSGGPAPITSGGNSGSSTMSDGDLGQALAALLSAPTGGNQASSGW
mmetsp:Transcript_14356/g.35795  ORF Transcript_14356/g.35795 Transcript_14356/m.35795 type:complete len:525 (+) Transcript_14356:1154-2728(+)